jgi:hypothetical protein
VKKKKKKDAREKEEYFFLSKETVKWMEKPSLGKNSKGKRKHACVYSIEKKKSIRYGLYRSFSFSIS